MRDFWYKIKSFFYKIFDWVFNKCTYIFIMGTLVGIFIQENKFIEFDKMWMWIENNPYKFTALFISACVFFITWWQAYQTVKHNKLSVEPNLNRIAGQAPKEGKNYYSIIIINTGVGPAVIKDVRTYIGEEEISHNSFNDLRKNIGKLLKEFDTCYFINGALLATNEENVVVGFFDKDESGDEKNRAKIKDNLGIYIEYQSIYRDKSYYFCKPNELRDKLPKKLQRDDWDTQK